MRVGGPNSMHKSMRAKNGRRIRLVEKKHGGGGLTADEAEELVGLTAEVSAYMERHHPRSTEVIDEFAAWVETLKARIRARKQ
jgi:hypothetical protein